MKIGIVSDIHGDYGALKSALDRLDEHHHVDQILCAGDLVGRGPDPEAVINLIRERGIPTVLGNHDEWSYGVSPESKKFLKSLPMDWEGNYEGYQIFMCHGKPGNNLWGLYRDHVSDTLLNMMLVSLDADILVTGHTHVPMFIRVAEGCVVNPGSLYLLNNARSSSHTYGVLSLPECQFDLYDLTAEMIAPMPI